MEEGPLCPLEPTKPLTGVLGLFPVHPLSKHLLNAFCIPGPSLSTEEHSGDQDPFGPYPPGAKYPTTTTAVSHLAIGTP